MNRRRALNRVHISMARRAREATASAIDPSVDLPITRMSIADLDRLGPKLVTSPARTTCPDCKGTGQVFRLITDDIERLVPCEECHGRGFYEERA